MLQAGFPFTERMLSLSLRPPSRALQTRPPDGLTSMEPLQLCRGGWAGEGRCAALRAGGERDGEREQKKGKKQSEKSSSYFFSSPEKINFFWLMS